MRHCPAGMQAARALPWSRWQAEKEGSEKVVGAQASSWGEATGRLWGER